MHNRRNIRGRQNNSARKKRLFSVFLLILSIVALTGGSYAWFSTNNAVDLVGVDIKVSPSSSLELSTDATDGSWKKSIEIDDIKNADYSYGVTRKNSYPTMYRPVSTIGELDNGYSKFFLGHIAKRIMGGYKISAEAIEETDGSEGNLMAFDLYLRTAKSQTLQLNLSGSSVEYTKLETDKNDLQGIENAIRVGFIIEGHALENEPVSSIQALKTANSNDIKIWEPNDNVHNAKAVEAASEFYNMTITSSQILDYEGIKAVIPENLDVLLGSSNSAYFGSLGTKLVRTENGQSGSIQLFRLEQGITKVRMYIWVEGQDVDCENAVSGTSFLTRLNFTTTES